MEMPIPDDWDGESCCRWVVYWPDSTKWQAILHGLIEQPSQGRFWDASTGNIVNTQTAFRPFYNLNFVLEEVFMSCNDTGMVTAFNSIAAAIRMLATKECCGGETPSTGGIIKIVLSNEGVSTPIYGSQPPGSLEPGLVPPDYPGTLEEYDADKCRTANELVSAWATTLDNLSYINFAQSIGLTAVVIAAVAGLITLPMFLIPVLIAAAILLVAVRETLRDLAQAIRDNRADLVCLLFTSDSTEKIIRGYSDMLDTLIAAIPAEGVIALALKTIALILANSDTLNWLFTMSQGAGAEYDCSGCEACPNYSFDPPGGTRGEMTLIAESAEQVEAQAAPNTGLDRWDWTVIIHGTPDFVRCGAMTRIMGVTITSGSFAPSGDANARILVRDNNGDVVYDNSSGVWPTFPIEGHVFTIVSGFDFSAEIHWEDL